jgi:8-oxo-dGTP diphosphatase
VIFDVHRRLAVVQVGERFFLPGGGSIPGEFPEDTLKREIREETGREIHHHQKIGEAVSYLFASGEENYYQNHGHYYSASLGKKIVEPVESDHILTWLEIQDAEQALPPAQGWAVDKANRARS